MNDIYKGASGILDTVMRQRLNASLINLPLAIMEFDSALRIVRWSDAAERMFGWSESEIFGKTIGDIHWVHDDDVESVRRIFKEMIDGWQPNHPMVNRNYRKDGSVTYCEWYHVVIHDEQERLSSIFSLVLDITERTLVKETLYRNIERVRRVDEIVHLGSWELDLVSNRLVWSSEVYRIFGLQPQEFNATYEAFLDP